MSHATLPRRESLVTALKARRLDRTLTTALPPLDPGMINVTAPKGHGYEFLPHAQHFSKPIDIAVPFDPTLIPEEMKPEDVHTYYFDPAADRLFDHIEKSRVHHRLAEALELQPGETDRLLDEPRE